jgi:hypothetical protein
MTSREFTKLVNQYILHLTGDQYDLTSGDLPRPDIIYDAFWKKPTTTDHVHEAINVAEEIVEYWLGVGIIPDLPPAR